MAVWKSPLGNDLSEKAVWRGRSEMAVWKIPFGNYLLEKAITKGHSKMAVPNSKKASKIPIFSSEIKTF